MNYSNLHKGLLAASLVLALSPMMAVAADQAMTEKGTVPSKKSQAQSSNPSENEEVVDVPDPNDLNSD